MITPKLKFNKRTASALDYNEKKVDADVAAIVHSRNLANTDKYALYSTMEKLESNPRIHRKTRRMGFHLAVSPGVDDPITNEEVIRLVDEIMSGLGYSDQPYVVYRHNDIMREHFHVVSCRVRPDGSIVRDCNDEYKIQHMLKELAPKYHFTPGLPSEKKRNQVRVLSSLAPGVLPKMSPKDENKKKKMLEIYDLALTFPFISFDQLQGTLATMGVEMKSVQSPDGSGTNIMLRGLDKNGKAATKWLSARNADHYAFSLYEGNVKRNILSRQSLEKPRQRLEVILTSCYNRSTSLKDLLTLLQSVGVNMNLPKKDRTKDKGYPYGISENTVFVDTKTQTVFSLYELNMMPCYEKLLASMANGKWVNGDARTTLSKSDKDMIKSAITTRFKQTS